MTENHPITPPPELVQQWLEDSPEDDELGIADYIATQAARWGAAQELEACCEWLYEHGYVCAHTFLSADRRPRPPSLKEQALAALNVIEDKMLGPTVEEKLIRQALEALND